MQARKFDEGGISEYNAAVNAEIPRGLGMTPLLVIPTKEESLKGKAAVNAEIPRGLGMTPSLVIPTKEESLKGKAAR